ncbi:MAG TPA: hypothetical protein VM008_12000 [Phycisphaerae bacterium]|nr:hypothetical protein [Phycisphaerae bacterium]
MEVLVSLIIVTLVLSAILDVSAHQRHVLADAQERRAAMDLAITWRSARLAQESWAQGDQGTFPDRDGPRWTLEPLPNIEVSNSGLEADSQWRQLHVLTTADDPTGVGFLLRLDPDDASTAAGGP